MRYAGDGYIFVVDIDKKGIQNYLPKPSQNCAFM